VSAGLGSEPQTRGLRSLDGKEVIWEPHPRQEIALTCPVDELLYGGAKGGGKSDFIIMAPYEQIALADTKFRQTGRRQRGRAVLFRKNLKRLDDLIMRSKELFPQIDPRMGMKGWNAEKKRWTFTSGYVFDFDHLDGPDDHEAYHGQEITALLFDQVEEIASEVYQYLVANVRSKDDDMRQLLMVRSTANPGGKHAKWVKDYFVSPCREGNKIITLTQKLPSGRERTTTRCFVPAKLEDNPNLYSDPQYEAALEKLPEHMRRMYRDGDWDVVIGSFFAAKFDLRVHVIPAFPLPPSWEVRYGLDWGSSAPAACEFGTRDNDGNLYFIDEIYGPGDTGRAFAERFFKKLANQKWSPAKTWTNNEMYGLVDNQAFYKTGAEGPTAGESMCSAGMRLFPANKNRKAGIEQWLERLTLDAFKQPKVYIFEGRCPRLVAALQAIGANDKDPDDYDPKDPEHSHPVDAGRYLLVDWPVGTSPENKNVDADVERWIRISEEKNARTGSETSTGYGD
jgi:hypothetical protein